MDIAVGTSSGRTVISLRGAVHHGDGERFREEIARQLEAGQSRLVADYTGLTYIDSTLIAETIDAFQRCREQGGSLQVVSPPGSRVRETLRITGVDRAIEVRDGLDDVSD